MAPPRYAESLERLLAAARERGRRPFQTIPLKDAPRRVASGDGPVASEGQRLESRHLLALAALGFSRVPVRLRPRVAFVSTGGELVECGRAPAPGQVRNATAPYLAAELERLGCQLLAQHCVGDDPAVFGERLEELLEQDLDLIFATGGLSPQRGGCVPEAVGRLGGETLFRETAMRPGGAILGARFGHGPLFLGLPGDPLSTVAGLRFFADPVLRWMLGRPQESPRRARLSARVDKPEGLRCFYEGKLDETAAGLEVRCLEAAGSPPMRPLLDADAWVALPEEASSLEKGAEADVFPL